VFALGHTRQKSVVRVSRNGKGRVLSAAQSKTKEGIDMSSLATVVPEVNQTKISKVRRVARRHGLRLVKCRNKRINRVEGPRYQLQAYTAIAGKEFDITLRDALDICDRLDGAR
jgi:hypothetical protein